MQLQSNSYSDKQVLFLIALLLGSIEVLLPRFPLFPWLKIGLPNIITLIWLIRYGVKEAFLFAFLRVWLLAFFFGFSPFSMTLALSGSLLSVTAISLLYRSRFFGIIMMGIVSAIMHNMGQLIALQLLFKGIPFAFFQIKMMLIISLITGTITALGAYYLEPHIKEKSSIKTPPSKELPLNKSYILASLSLAGIILTIVEYNSLPLLGGAIVTLLLSYRIIQKDSSHLIRLLKNFWLFLLLIFLSHFSPTKSDWIVEGAIHLSTLLLWISSSLWFRYFQADRAMFKALKKIFKRSEESFEVALDMVELFPTIVEVSRREILAKPSTLIKEPQHALLKVLEIARTVEREYKEK